MWGRSLRESVDWNDICESNQKTDLYCRSLRESVDWNSTIWQSNKPSFASLSSWERGLKYFEQSAQRATADCRSLRESVDWNYFYNFIKRLFPKSLSSWERGLKYRVTLPLVLATLSLSSWERGLKLLCFVRKYQLFLVALFVRAWIEIRGARGCWTARLRVALFVREWIEIWVVRLSLHLPHSRSLRESVDWNSP